MHQVAPLAGERYHLLGISGRGLAPLSVVVRHLGADVSGCDPAGAPAVRRFLAESGMAFETANSADHVVPGTTVVATSVAHPDHPEIRAAADAGQLWHRTDLLAAVLRARRGAGITGSHGKGTVTALAVAALEAAGKDPLGLVGAVVPALGGMTRLGSGPSVAEVDDSDLSLSRVETEVAVVTNLDHDHPYLGLTLRDSVAGIGEFLSRARQRVVVGPSPRADALASCATADVWRYGRDFFARTLAVDGHRTRLELHAPGGERIRTEISLIGPKIAGNAALAFVTAIALGADPEAAASGLGRISRLTRRLEHIGTRDGIHVFDDYGGKHPVAVREGLLALRRHFPRARLTAVFEPFGAYLAPWGRRYARALGRADHVVLVPPILIANYDNGRSYDEDWMSALAAPVHAVDQHDAVDRALEASRAGDVVVFFATADRSQVMAQRAVMGGVTG